MVEKIRSKLRELLDNIAPSPEAVRQREVAAIRLACCQLLMEVVRLDAANAMQKREVVALALRELFDMPEAELAVMIESAGRMENRPTSYFDSVSVINRSFDLSRKALFVEYLWRVAGVDGDIDMYEDHLVRKLADLMYVPHSDFILAKNRVRAQVAAQLN